MQLGELAKVVGGVVAPELAERSFGRVVLDSRQVRAGDLFVAVQGARLDGADFVSDALGRGAAAALSSRPGSQVVLVKSAPEALRQLALHRRRRTRAQVVAITGTAGKSTTREFLAAALGQFGPVHHTSGNLNTDLGQALTLANAPDHAAFLVLEVGVDRPGDMGKALDLIRPHLGVLTAIGPAHLALLGSVDAVWAEKSALLRQCGGAICADALPQERLREVKALRYGLSPLAQFQGTDLAVSAEGTTFTVEGLAVHLRSPGAHLAQNALGALAVCRLWGLDLRRAQEGLARARAPHSRAELRRLGPLHLIDDSYNANPVSAQAALLLLQALPAPRVAVLGDMCELGPDTERYHFDLGQQAARAAQLVVASGQFAEQVAAGARVGHSRALVVATPEEAWEVARGELAAGGSALIKGSRAAGMERAVVAFEKGAGAAGCG